MNTITTIFLGIGGIGLAVLALALIFGDIVHFGDVTADGPFTLPVFAAFVGAVGFVGAITAQLIDADTTVATVASTLVGVCAAVPTAWLTMRLARAARRMRTDATPTRTDLLGRIGVVVTPIPANGYGEIRISLGGQPVKLNARAERPVSLGAQVFVVEATSDTSVVVEQTITLR